MTYLSDKYCFIAKILFLLVIPLNPASSYRSSNTGQISCAQRHHLIGLKDRDRIVTVERVLGSRVTLTCHFCSESDNGRPTRWYWSRDLWNVDVAGSEVDTSDKEGRFSVARDHSLTIKDLDVNDTGLYYCFDVHHSDGQNKFVYAVDMLFPQAVEPIVGRSDADLERYIRDYVNKTLHDELEPHWRFKNVELYVQWEPWSQCRACKDQPGEMWRLGQLRLRHFDFQHEALTNTRGEQSVSFKVGLAARSMHVFLHEKQLSLCVRELPDYLQKMNCTSARGCRHKKSRRNMRAEKSFLAQLGPEPRKHFTHTVYEHDPVILECPWQQEQGVLAKLKKFAADSRLGRLIGFGKPQRPKDRDVFWYYYATLLNKSSLFEQTAHRMRVSRDGRLMFGAVQKADTGRYSCAEDGVDIAVILLKIKPTFDLSQSRTSFRIISVSMAFNGLVFLLVMVVLFRQRRVQRLLAGARWRHELREHNREERDRRKRFLVRQKRQLSAMNVDADDASQLLGIMEQAMGSDDGDKNDEEYDEDENDDEYDDDENDDEYDEDEDDEEYDDDEEHIYNESSQNSEHEDVVYGNEQSQTLVNSADESSEDSNEQDDVHEESASYTGLVV